VNGTPNESVTDAGAAYVFTGFGPVPSTAPIITGYSGGPGGFTIHYDAGGPPVTIDRSNDLWGLHGHRHRPIFEKLNGHNRSNRGT
jgi:hypothetical protein